VRRLTEGRLAANLSCAQLGYMAKVHPARVGAIESGRFTPPVDSVELQRLAKALGYAGTPGDLLSEVEEVPHA
jgi:hypothetical protein